MPKVLSVIATDFTTDTVNYRKTSLDIEENFLHMISNLINDCIGDGEGGRRRSEFDK